MSKGLDTLRHPGRTVAALVLATAVLASCVQQDTRAGDSGRDEAVAMLSYRSVADGSAGREDECACLKTDAARIEGFTDNMKRSRYSMFYLALGREKLQVLRRRAGEINCRLD